MRDVGFVGRRSHPAQVARRPGRRWHIAVSGAAGAARRRHIRLDARRAIRGEGPRLALRAVCRGRAFPERGYFFRLVVAGHRPGTLSSAPVVARSACRGGPQDGRGREARQRSVVWPRAGPIADNGQCSRADRRRRKDRHEEPHDGSTGNQARPFRGRGADAFRHGTDQCLGPWAGRSGLPMHRGRLASLPEPDRAGAERFLRPDRRVRCRRTVA